MTYLKNKALPSMTATPSPATLQKQMLAMRAAVSLMAQAIHLVDDDIEQTGTVSVQTIEFLRSVKQVLA